MLVQVLNFSKTFIIFVVYHCGSDDGWSNLFNFITIKRGENWSPRLAFYCDLGNVNPQSVPRLQEDVQKSMYDVILHVGDFAYNMDSVSLVHLNTDCQNKLFKRITQNMVMNSCVRLNPSLLMFLT